MELVTMLFTVCPIRATLILGAVAQTGFRVITKSETNIPYLVMRARPG
jgi:hypothetical protein